MTAPACTSQPGCSAKAARTELFGQLLQMPSSDLRREPLHPSMVGCGYVHLRRTFCGQPAQGFPGRV